MCRVAGDLFDHEPGDDMANGVVPVRGTRLIQGALFDRPINDFLWFEWGVESSAREYIKTEVERELGETVGVIENLTDGDGVAVVNTVKHVARSPTLA